MASVLALGTNGHRRAAATKRAGGGDRVDVDAFLLATPKTMNCFEALQNFLKEQGAAVAIATHIRASVQDASLQGA